MFSAKSLTFSFSVHSVFKHANTRICFWIRLTLIRIFIGACVSLLVHSPSSWLIWFFTTIGFTFSLSSHLFCSFLIKHANSSSSFEFAYWCGQIKRKQPILYVFCFTLNLHRPTTQSFVLKLFGLEWSTCCVSFDWTVSPSLSSLISPQNFSCYQHLHSVVP